MRAIFTFHSIDNSSSVLSYTPDLLSALLSEFAAKNIPVYDLETLLKPETSCGVALTFDDGMRSVFTNALPILKDYDACAHVFVTTEIVNRSQRWLSQSGASPGFEMLNWDEIEQLHKAGIFIDAHTQTHPDLRGLTGSAIAEECDRADEVITERLGRRPKFFAYPFGYHNKKVRDYARNRYHATVTTELRMLGDAEDSAALPRLDSYYFRSRQVLKGLDTYALNTYIRLRWLLRTCKGSHCRANFN